MVGIKAPAVIILLPINSFWCFLSSFLKALLFVMMDLTGEVSSGAVDMAKSNLEKMLVS